jgi:hypothetical protein
MWRLPCRIGTSIAPVPGSSTVAVTLRLANVLLRWTTTCCKSAFGLVARDAKAVCSLSVREEANGLVGSRNKLEYQNEGDTKEHDSCCYKYAVCLKNRVLSLRDSNERHIGKQ